MDLSQAIFRGLFNILGGCYINTKTVVHVYTLNNSQQPAKNSFKISESGSFKRKIRNFKSVKFIYQTEGNLHLITESLQRVHV